jgi:hypothetical protein
MATRKQTGQLRKEPDGFAVLDGHRPPAFPLEGWNEIAREVKERYKAVLPVS